MRKITRKISKDSRLPYIAIGNIIAFIAVVIVNYLAVSLPLNGLSTGALANYYPNLFTPAGFTFSIWGIIYILLFGFSIRQIRDLYKPHSQHITKKIGLWFIWSCLINIAWIFAWHYQYVLTSVCFIIAYLLILIEITQNIHTDKKLGSRKDKLLAQIPFSILLGRLSVATIANISARLVYAGRNMRGLTNIFRTSLVINVATILGLTALRKKSDITYVAVIIRAFIGIIAKRIAEGPLDIQPIFRSLGIGIGLMSLGIIVRFNKRRKN